MSILKTGLAAALSFGVLVAPAVAMPFMHRHHHGHHQVCSYHHHHRVCR